jgi:hypothetical protein
LDEEAVVLDAIATARKLSLSDLFDSDGPLWYRGSVSCGALIEEHRFLASLAALGADRLVVGHTPTPDRRVLQRFDGRLIEVDTGMLNFYYKGSGNALILDGDSVSVVSQSGADRYSPVAHPRGIGLRPDNMSSEQLLTLLETGEILSQQEDLAGRLIVEISDGSSTVSAIFKERSGRGFYPDVAAYRLDRLLELDMVPATVLREVNGAGGSLQYLAPKYYDESQRSASGQGGGAACPVMDQWSAMYVFDVLIYNEGRSMQRMLYNTASWRLMLIEHDLAFASKKGRPRHLNGISLEISDGWRHGLAGLTDEVLAENISDVLDRRRLKALAARRNELLAASQAK